MKGNRDKIQNETLPNVEIKTHERRTEIRYDFSEISETDPDTGETRTSFNYKYIKVYDLKDIQLNDALSQIRTKIINDPSQIENPVAFKGRRWEELICELEEDETKKGQLLNANTYAEEIIPMPEEGQWVEKSIIYELDGEYWGAIQPHNRMHYHPSDTPNLFNLIPMNLEGGYPEWEQPAGAHDAYNTGDIVTKNNVLYKSRIDANTTDPELYNDTDSPWNYWDKEPFDEK